MVKWTNHAKRQLRHIYDYIAHDSPMYAKRVSEEPKYLKVSCHYQKITEINESGELAYEYVLIFTRGKDDLKTYFSSEGAWSG